MLLPLTRSRLRSGLLSACLFAALAPASLTSAQVAPTRPVGDTEQTAESSENSGRRTPLDVIVTQIQTQRVIYKPGHHTTTTTPPRFVPRGPGCTPIKASVANQYDAVDVGSEITLQAGMVRNEGFGSSYTIVNPGLVYPIEVQTVEFLLGTAAAGIGANINLGYRIEVYDGNPDTGVLVFATDSQNPQDAEPDPALVPFASLARVQGTTCNSDPFFTGTRQASALRVQFSVDQTADPADRILISSPVNPGIISMVVKINQHNADGAQCDAPPICSNAFMCTEGTSISGQTNTLNFSSRNWLIAVACPPLIPGFPACPGGTYAFSNSAISLCKPSRDVLQQLTYVTSACPPAPTGACCNPATGACAINDQAACGSSSYQGDGTTCSPNPCPQPSRACCTNGACTVVATNLCTSGGGTVQGNATTCNGINCPVPSGACCTGTGGCAVTTQPSCATFGGNFIGANTTCSGAGGTCPLGACCLPNGSCVGSISQPACTAQSGSFQGVGSVCSGVSCPQPSGACCTTSGSCASATQATCNLFGGTWQGAFTSCTPTICNPNGVCCRGATCTTGLTAATCVDVALPSGGVIKSVFVSSATSCNNGVTTSPCCYANFDKSADGIQVADIFAFLSAWFSPSPYAITGNNTTGGASPTGNPGVPEIFSFLSAWFAGGCA